MLYFMRHAESEANVLGILAGQKDDSKLTPRGEAQALAAAKAMVQHGIKIDRIVSSPLLRAQRTAEIVADELGLAREDIKYDDRAKEYDVGELTDQPESEVTTRDRLEALGEEDPLMFMQRVSDMLKELRSETGNTLLISHAGIGKVIEAAEIGLDPERFFEIEPYANAQLVELG